MARNGDAGTLLLAIVVGNTNIGVGVFDGDDLVADWRLSTQHDTMPDEYAVLLSSLMAHRGLSFGGLDAAIIASVVPQLTSNLIEMIEKTVQVKPLVVGRDMGMGDGGATRGTASGWGGGGKRTLAGSAKASGTRSRLLKGDVASREARESMRGGERSWSRLRAITTIETVATIAM